MGKKKRGRIRGRNNYGAMMHRNRGRPYRDNSVQPGNNNGREPEPVDTGEEGPLQEGGGVLEMHPNGYGFLRDPAASYVRQMTDPFVPGSMIEKYALREGILIHGLVQPGRRHQGPRLREIVDVDGL